ncbi:AAA family ATPase [Kineococcus auxinigenes]|uniref:AAA family ATPase n=1 Tax=unclassified Kineococcus TaxID=2621656 RepID=UPI003D7EF387
MIENLSVENFKAFRSASLDFRPLTTLTGLNSAGKSTVLQALLLAQQACEGDGDISLNNRDGLALGEALDVLYAEAETSSITISVTVDGATNDLVFDVPDARTIGLELRPVTAITMCRIVHTYLSAERLGPRDLLEVSAETRGRLTVGHQGQFTAHVLAEYGREQVQGTLIHPGSEHSGTTVSRQVESWMSSILGDLQIQSTWLPSTSAAMLRFKGRDVLTEWLRPANVGFGLTFALPIILAILTARTGDTVLVENPEAHLHPRAQSAMGRFLGRAAGGGIQIVVETHSDHVINGMRLAVAEDRTLQASDLGIYYFGGAGDVITIEATASGGLSEWPAGFFDQAEHDLAKLSRIRRAPLG